MVEDYPEPETEVPSISPTVLYQKLIAGDPLTLVDVRDRDEFEAWRIHAPSATVTHLPYIRFVEADVTESVETLVSEHELAEPIVAVCGRGEASAYAAGVLREAGFDASNLAEGMIGWAQVYVTADLDVEPAVRQYYRPASGCLSYLIAGDSAAIVVDPLRSFVDRYATDAADLGMPITHAVDTHIHADHLSGVRTLTDLTAAEPVLPVGARDRGLAFGATLLSDGDTLPIEDTELVAIHAPGHTSEMTAFRIDDILLSGDSLFLGSVARPDLETTDDDAPQFARRLYHSLHDRLLGLPDETVVAPGHTSPLDAPTDTGAYTAPLGDLRDMPLLELEVDAFVATILTDMPPQPANFETIIDVNLGHKTVTQSDGFELELGPNNCAVSA